MKNFTIQKCLLYFCLVNLTLFTTQNVSAQYSNFTLDAKAGTTFILGSVSPLPGVSSSLSLRYAPGRLISAGAFISTGVLWGNGDATRQTYSGSDKADQYYQEKFKFNTEFYTWGGNAYLNLQKLFNPIKKPKNIIPYFYAGAGYMRARSEAESLENENHTIRYFTYYTADIGLEIKIKGTKNLDYLISVQQNLTETPFLDGIPYDKKLDSFISFSAGVSYHLCFDKRKTPIDWTRDYCCPLFQY